MTNETDAARDVVRRYYATAANNASMGRSACYESETTSFGACRSDDLDDLPAAARLASIRCRNPTTVADLRPGDTVLDLGSGDPRDMISHVAASTSGRSRFGRLPTATASSGTVCAAAECARAAFGSTAPVRRV